MSFDLYKLRILIVDSAAEYALNLRTTLRAHGHFAEIARSRRGALRILDEREFDAVLVDPYLSAADPQGGTSLAAEIQAMRVTRDQEIPVVICLSAVWNTRLQRRIDEADAIFAWKSDFPELMRKLEYAFFVIDDTKKNGLRMRAHYGPGDRSTRRLLGLSLLGADGEELPLTLQLSRLLVLHFRASNRSLRLANEDVVEMLQDNPWSSNHAGRQRRITGCSLRTCNSDIMREIGRVCGKLGAKVEDVVERIKFGGKRRGYRIRIRLTE